MIQRKIIRRELLTSWGLACAINEAFHDGYKLRGVEVFAIGNTPQVDFYLEREVDEGKFTHIEINKEN